MRSFSHSFLLGSLFLLHCTRAGHSTALSLFLVVVSTARLGRSLLGYIVN